MNWISRLLWGGRREPPRSWEAWIIEARSHSGYEREAAVQALAASGHGACLPVLLERANDWVPEVRLAARKALAAFLSDEHISSWALALGAVAALQRGARDDHAEILGRIQAYLRRPPNLAALRAASKAMLKQASRLLFELELQAAGDEGARFTVLRGAVLSGDAVVASKAVDCIDTLESAARRLQLAGAACLSSFAPVRQAGLRWALASPAPSTTNLVRARCKDRNASVRALALAALPGQHGQILQEARDTFLGTGPARDRAVALDVICELDPAAASVQCEQGCADRAAIVRERAYGRRFRMAQGEERDALVPLSLSDPSPRVRGLAAKQVARGVSAPGAERLLSIVDADPAALGSVARVAAHLSPWIRLAFLLAALPRFAGHQATVQRLHLELERWIADMSRCFVSPSGEQRGPVSRAWAAARDELPAAIQRRVSDQMQAFGLLRS